MTDFPSLINQSIAETFHVFREQVLIFFPLAFLVRLMINFCLFNGKESHFNLLRDTFIMWALLFIFTDLISWTLKLPSFIRESLRDSKVFEVPLSDSWITSFLSKITDYVAIVCYWISYSVYILIITVLSLLSCHVIFYATMTRSYLVLKMFLSLFFVTALWPIFWYGINFSIKNLLLTDNAFGNNIVLTLGSLLKIVFPLLSSFKFFNNPVVDTIASGSQKAGSLGKSIRVSSNYISQKVQSTASFVNKSASNFKNHSLRNLSYSEDSSIRGKESKFFHQGNSFFSVKNLEGANSSYEKNMSHATALKTEDKTPSQGNQANSHSQTFKSFQSSQNSQSHKGHSEPFQRTTQQKPSLSSQKTHQEKARELKSSENLYQRTNHKREEK